MVPFVLYSISKKGKCTSAPCNCTVTLTGKVPLGNELPLPSLPSQSTLLDPAEACPVIVRAEKAAGVSSLIISILKLPCTSASNSIYPPLLLTCPTIPSTPFNSGVETSGTIGEALSQVVPDVQLLPPLLVLAIGAVAGRSVAGKV